MSAARYAVITPIKSQDFSTSAHREFYLSTKIATSDITGGRAAVLKPFLIDPDFFKREELDDRRRLCLRLGDHTVQKVEFISFYASGSTALEMIVGAEHQRHKSFFLQGNQPRTVATIVSRRDCCVAKSRIESLVVVFRRSKDCTTDTEEIINVTVRFRICYGFASGDDVPPPAKLETSGSVIAGQFQDEYE